MRLFRVETMRIPLPDQTVPVPVKCCKFCRNVILHILQDEANFHFGNCLRPRDLCFMLAASPKMSKTLAISQAAKNYAQISYNYLLCIVEIASSHSGWSAGRF